MVKINRPKLNNLTIEKILEDNVILACILICLYLFVPLEALEVFVKLEVILSRRELFRELRKRKTRKSCQLPRTKVRGL